MALMVRRVALMALAAAFLLLPAMSWQANRILPGDSQLMLTLLPQWVLVLTTLVWAASWRSEKAFILLLLMLPVLAYGATLVAPESHRIALGSSIWLLLALSLVFALQLKRPQLMLLLVLMLWCAALASVPMLSLRLEFVQQQEAFGQELLTHLALVLISLLITGFIAALLTLLVFKHWLNQRLVFALLSFFQTIPSIALFGLLMVPLSMLGNWLPWLGVSGIGTLPAVIALVAYSLLPMVRNAIVGLQAVEQPVLNAAVGMGMSRRQVFFQVQLPLALPVMIEGVRVSCVQAIGLVVIAALVGAGGMGRFVFQGLGQAAMELVLLGALPTVAMAVLADVGFSQLAKWVRHD